MKILQLTTKVPYPPKDGGAAGIFVFSKVLQELGHSVAILAFNPPKHFISRLALSDLPPSLQIHMVEIDTKPSWYKALTNLIFKTIPYQVERFANQKFEGKLLELLVQFDPDVVQLEGVYLCPYIEKIRAHSKARIVLRAHNIEYMLWQNISENEPNLIKRVYLAIQAKRVKRFEVAQFSNVDGVTTVTQHDLSVVEMHHPITKMRAIPFGIEIKPKPNRVKYNTEAISFIGALDWMPNQEAMLWFIRSVWPLLQHNYPSLQFHIAGRNAPMHLKSLIEQQPGVIFHGEVNDSTEFLNQFSIIIVPLFAGSGIRVKIIEAMDHGLVVIASAKAVEGIPAISGQHLLIANTPEDFLNEITRVFGDTSLMDKLSANAMAFVRENFDILVIGSELIDFYNQISND